MTHEHHGESVLEETDRRHLTIKDKVQIAVQVMSLLIIPLLYWIGSNTLELRDTINQLRWDIAVQKNGLEAHIAASATETTKRQLFHHNSVAASNCTKCKDTVAQ